MSVVVCHSRMRKRTTSNTGKSGHELLFLSSKYIENRGNDNHPNRHALLSEENMIKLESEVQLLYGCWKMDNNSKYFVSTGSINSIISIICNSGIDFVSITSIGVKSLSIGCIEHKDETLRGNDSARNFQRKEIIEVPVPPSLTNDDQDLPLQYLSFRTPWPCSHLQASFTPIDGNFVTILKISTYCDSMPSSMCTPIK